MALKLKASYDQETLAIISGIVTLISILPSNLALFARPSKGQFLASLLNTSLAFFLFSYQVHEKSILLVAIPALMNLKAFKGQRYSDFAITWFAIVTTFSMWPLLQKDGLALAFLALQVIFITTCHYSALFEFNHDNDDGKKRSSPKPLSQTELCKASILDWLVWTLFNFSLVGFATMALASVYVLPPPNYPHIWPLMISVMSAGHFMGFLAYFNFCQYKLFSALGAPSEEKKKN